MADPFADLNLEEDPFSDLNLEEDPFADLGLGEPPPSGRTDLYLQNLGLNLPDERREEAERKLAGYAFGKIGEKVGRAGEGIDVEPAVRAQEELVRRYGSSSAERQLKAIESERPEPVREGELSPLESLMEYGEAGVIAAGAVLGAPAALAVAVPRGLMSGASARADAAGLKGKTRYEREKWLTSLNKEDSGYEAYKGLVEGHNEADRVRAEIEKLPEKDRGRFGGILGGMLGSEESTRLHRELFDAESRVTEATASLTKDYFLPGGTRNPYGTRAPVPYEGPSDVTENLLRGVLGMTDSEDLAKTRNAMQAAGGVFTDLLSLPVALYNTETNKFLTTSRLHDAKEEVRQEFEARGEAIPTAGVVSAMAQQRLAEQRKRRREAGDTSDGLFLPELLALVAPEAIATRMLPRAAKVVVTNAGRLTEAGADYVRGVKGAYQRSLARAFETADAGRIERGLDPIGGAAKSSTFIRLDRTVDLAMAKAGDDALLEGKRLEAVDLSEAVKLTDDGGVDVNLEAVRPIFADDAMSGTKAVSKDAILADTPRATDDIFADHKRRSLVLDAGRRVVAEIRTNLGGPGAKVVQVTPELRAKIGAEAGMPFFGDFAVYSPGKGYKRFELSDFNPPRMGHAVKALAKKRGLDKASVVRLVDEAAHKIGRAAASPEDREVIGEFMELLGNPSKDADDAVSLIEGLRTLIKDSVTVVPRMASQAERDALSASAAAIKASEKARELSIRAKGPGALKEARKAQAVAEGLQAEAHAAALLTGADPALVRGSKEATAELVKANEAIRSAESNLGAARNRVAQLTNDLRLAPEADPAEATGLIVELSKAEKASVAAEAGLETARAARHGAESAAKRISLEEKPYLDNFVLQTLKESMTSAQTVREILHSMTGAATKEEFRRLHSMYKQLRSYEEVAADKFFTDADRLAAIDRLTVSDSVQAKRALERFSEGRLGRADFDALSPAVKDAVEVGRRAMDEVYDLLVADGALAGGRGDKAAFFDRMRVEGYLPHILTSSGARKIAGLSAKASKAYGATIGDGALSTTILNTFMRKRKGSARAVNEQVRGSIAESVYDDMNRQRGARADRGLAASKEVRDLLGLDKESALRAISQKLGLDEFNYFEADPVFAMIEYGRRVGKGLANRRFLGRAKEAYPDGDVFAAMAGRGGLITADSEAGKVGYQRLKRSGLFDLYASELSWEGWRKYAGEIREFIKQHGDEDRASFMKGLGALGVDPAKIPKGEIDLIWSNHIYLPKPIADGIDSMARPDWLAGLKNADSKLVSELGLTFDEMLRTFKVFVTIFAPAFHGRNFISNVVQNTMVHGMDALNPATHTEAIWLMNAPEDKKWTLAYVDSAGATQRETKTVGEWRALAERHGVDTDAITVTDVQRLTGSVKSDKMDGLVKNLLAKPSGDTLAPLLRHLAVQGAVPGGAGAAAGAIAGLTSDEKDDLADRISRVVGLMGVGFFAGAAGKTNYDMFLSRAFKARRDALDGGATASKAWRIARDAALQDSMETLKASARVGTGAGVLGTAAGVMGAGDFLLTGGATAAAMGASRLGLEGLSHFAGGIGRSIERQARYVNWLAGMKKGLPGDAAARLVNRTLFDYQDLSWAEKYVWRRVFPFWTWNSKNVALQGWLMANRPGKFMMMDRILNLQTKETIRDQDMAGIPNHMRYRIVMSLGPGKVLSGLGLPIESIAELSKPGRIGSYSLPGLGGILSNMNPIVPFMMRFALGTDPYYRVDITNIRSARDVRYLPESLQDWVGLAQVAQKDKRGKVIGIKYQTGHKGVGKKQGAYRMALLRSLPTWRLVSEYNKIVADTFMTGTAARAGEKRATPSERVAAFLFAWRSYSLDPAAMEDRMWYFYEKALQDIGKSEGWLGHIAITKRLELGMAP